MCGHPLGPDALAGSEGVRSPLPSVEADPLGAFDCEPGLGAVLEYSIQAREGDAATATFELFEEFAPPKGSRSGPVDTDYGADHARRDPGEGGLGGGRTLGHGERGRGRRIKASARPPRLQSKPSSVRGPRRRMEFDRFTAVLLESRPDAPHLTEDEANALQDAQMDPWLPSTRRDRSWQPVRFRMRATRV
jgi:hypothetical protein